MYVVRIVLYPVALLIIEQQVASAVTVAVAVAVGSCSFAGRLLAALLAACCLGVFQCFARQAMDAAAAAANAGLAGTVLEALLCVAVLLCCLC